MVYKYTYIVECRTPAVCPNEREAYDGDIWHVTYYVGGTNNPRQRIEAHLVGKGATYLKGREMRRACIVDTSTIAGDLVMYYTEAFVKRYYTHQKREAAMNGTVPFWRPFWHRCNHEHAYQAGTATSIETCPDCHGSGGVFD